MFTCVCGAPGNSILPWVHVVLLMLPKERRVISPTVERMSNVHKRSTVPQPPAKWLASMIHSTFSPSGPQSSGNPSTATLVVTKTCLGTETLLLAAVFATSVYLLFTSFPGTVTLLWSHIRVNVAIHQHHIHVNVAKHQHHIHVNLWQHLMCVTLSELTLLRCC